jgi:hypothetical protein
MSYEMMSDEVCKEFEKVEKFESKVKFFGRLINEDEMEEIFESEVEKIYYGFGMDCSWNGYPTNIEDIIEDVPEDWNDRDGVISDICYRWHEFLERFARQNFPPELEKVLEILKQIGYDDEYKIEDFFYGACNEAGIDDYTLEELLHALYKAKILNMEMVDFILSVAKQLVEKKHLTYSER